MASRVRKPSRCLMLLSGGLDSMLAARLLLEQGAEVIGLTFESPFYGAQRGARAAELLGIEHHVIDVTDEIIAIVKAPRHGYGKNMNPCIDCHALMVRTAASSMDARRASFVATGEVLGERPKSQHEGALRTVEEEGGLPGLVLRPLSAQLLRETIPERSGWVDRSRLRGFFGRQRAAQFELAAAFGIDDFPTPGGGCHLTELAFCARLRELLARHPEAEASSYRLLAVGRHSWEGDAMIVVGRDRLDNQTIAALATDRDVVLRLSSDLGPTTLVRWPDDQAVRMASAMTARYSQERERDEVLLALERVGAGFETLVCTAHRGGPQFTLVEE